MLRVSSTSQERSVQSDFGDGRGFGEYGFSNTELSEFFGSHRVPTRLGGQRAESSVSSSRPFICVPKQAH